MEVTFNELGRLNKKQKHSSLSFHPHFPVCLSHSSESDPEVAAGLSQAVLFPSMNSGLRGRMLAWSQIWTAGAGL